MIEEMLEKGLLNEMGNNAKKIAINNAKERIYNEIELLLSRK